MLLASRLVIDVLMSYHFIFAALRLCMSCDRIYSTSHNPTIADTRDSEPFPRWADCVLSRALFRIRCSNGHSLDDFAVPVIPAIHDDHRNIFSCVG
jgi:hypothetical protein